MKAKLFNLLFVLSAITGGISIASAQCSPAVGGLMTCQVPSGSSTTQYYGVGWNSGYTGVTTLATTSSAGSFVGIAEASVTGGAGQTVVVALPGNFCSGACGIAFDATPTAGHGFRLSPNTGGEMQDIGSSNCDNTCVGYVFGTSSSNSGGFLLGHLPEATTGILLSGSASTQSGGTLYLVNNAGTSGAFTYTLPTALGALGNGGPVQQFCFINGANSSRTLSTGTMTITAASGDYIFSPNASAFGTSGGNEVSTGTGGAVGCFIAMQANQWYFFPGKLGTWTP